MYNSYILTVDTLKFMTNSSKSYNQVYVSVLDREYIIFHVKAAASAYVALTNIHGVTNTQTYELCIGADNNMKTTLKVRDSATTSVCEAGLKRRCFMSIIKQ